MKTIQEKLEAISLDLDAIIIRLHSIIKEKHYHSKSVKLKNMSYLIEYLQDLEHIIKIGKNIVKLILLENMPKTPKILNHNCYIFN